MKKMLITGAMLLAFIASQPKLYKGKTFLSEKEMLSITAKYPKGLITKAVINGDNLIVKMDNGSGPEEVALSTDCKLTFDLAMAKATTKDSGGYEESIAGNMKWSMDTNGMVDFHPSAGFLGAADLMAGIMARQKVTLYFTLKSPSTGDKQYWGVAFITKCEVDSKQGAVVTYSASFEGTGALTLITS